MTRYTTYRAVESGGEAWEQIVAGDIGEPAPSAWGGYHDAGDWNPRRVTHMQVTMAMHELYEQVSWLNSFATYVYAPDYDASWFYAADGARLARLLKPLDLKLSTDYLQSAQLAFDFAENDYPHDKANGGLEGREEVWVSVDHRNLAALELYRATSNQRYYNVFLQDSVLSSNTASILQWGVHVQRDHVFAYWMMHDELSDPALKKRARQQLVEQAELAIAYGNDNAFGLTTPDRFKPPRRMRVLSRVD